ncbi:NAC domain-containing protein 96-like isoform X2 [Cynara cardunculus var. scolymus]|uniref:NAC domain-containing protein 96-like isoform X2 n=1 Tax=Cynara cardunculus var. scolymus TaxID=59895 RepID=UPI000D629D16|nr:NAC domain-containing protein 96-like isoform X2 [Cynara cardunculus var. scolymus]
MCPPASVTAPAIELDNYWTDEVVCKSLVQFKSGCPLPLNVLPDVDPYECMPSNLPENMWYFCSGTKKDAEHGFWMSTGEACEIYSTSVFTGLRKTLQFYEGQAPNGQKTNWMMQEYTTTEKYSNKLDCRALCRVFLADDKRSSRRLSESELLEKRMDDGTGASAMANTSPDPPSAMADTSPDPPSAMADTSPDQPSGMGNNRSPDWPPENIPDREYVLMGDYLELDDLAASISHSSSSADSSCMTMTSEEFFDPVALMRELGDDIVHQEVQDSSVKLNLSAPTKLKEVIMDPTTLGFCDDGKECKPSITQASKTDDTPQNEPGDDRKESTSNGINTTAAAAASSSSEEKKDRGGGTKKRKVMKYLCFLAF